MNKSGTLGDLFEFLLPGCLARRRPPAWPPDTFALVSTALEASGAYTRVAEPPPVSRSLKSPAGRQSYKDARKVGSTWRTRLNDAVHKKAVGSGDIGKAIGGIQLPKVLRQWWDQCRRSQSQSLLNVYNDEDLCEALLALCAAADEASGGIGVNSCSEDYEQDGFVILGDGILDRNERATCCLEVNRIKASVLPKQHVPQRGLSLRSLTHHLALCTPAGVTPTWNVALSGETCRQGFDVLNVLLLPWPLDTDVTSFHVHHPSDLNLGGVPESFRFFSYDCSTTSQGSNFTVVDWITNALKSARQYAARIDVIVLPEAALSWAEYCQVERLAIAEEIMVISGVIKPAEQKGEWPRNLCCVQPLGLKFRQATSDSSVAGQIADLVRIAQSKHHRWCLDRNQIIQYGLGGRLPASKDCWEQIDLGRRELNFVTLDPWVTLCVLLCEDLAQQDPVADILRAVGPTLVVALLMDGPQLKHRWPSRYASVLADDPGSSVLTLTSLGMAKRSKPRRGDTDRRNVIALWRDVKYGERELELSQDDNAAVLSLVPHFSEEFTADGRGDDGMAFFPVFGGFYSMRVSR